MLRLHKWKLLGLSVMALLTLIFSLGMGATKSVAQINWLDVTSEGGAALLALVWLLLILNSRPRGRVTQWLSLGLSLIFLSQFQDWLDEFIAFRKDLGWDHWIESGFMLPGLGLLTYGIYLWHLEQLALNRQRQKRERLFREHQSLDQTTLLNRADYLRAQLARELQTHRAQAAALALVIVDVEDFAGFNRHWGSAEGDRYLLALSELLLLNLREQDLLCRYAGDRFALILPYTSLDQARQLARELAAAAQHFAFKPRHAHTSVFMQLNYLALSARNESAEQLLERANCELVQSKAQPDCAAHPGLSAVQL